MTRGCFLRPGWALVWSACAPQPRAPVPAAPSPAITEQPASLPPPPGTLFTVHGDGWRVRPMGSRLVAVGRDRFVTLSMESATLWDPALGRVAGVDSRSPSLVVAPTCDTGSMRGCWESPLVTPDGAWVLTVGVTPEGEFAQVARRLDPTPVPGWREAAVVQEATDGGFAPTRFQALLHLAWNDDDFAIVDEGGLYAPSCIEPEQARWGPAGRTVVCQQAEGWVWAWPGGEVIARLPTQPVELGFSVDGGVLAAYDGRDLTVASTLEGVRFVRPGVRALPVGVGALLVGDAWLDARDGSVLAPTAPSAHGWLFHPDGTVWPGGSPCAGRQGPAPCPVPSARDLGIEFPTSGLGASRGWSFDFLPDGSVAVLAAPPR